MNVEISTKDTGYNALLRRLKSPEVTAGVHSSDGAAIEEGSDYTVAEIAAIHEFGFGGVEERSWLRDFIDENRTKLLDMLEKTSIKILEGTPPDVAMNRYGLAVVGMIKERIIAGIDPPLAEATKREKHRVTGGSAKDTPLIRFGQFVSAIAHEVTIPR